MESVDEGDFRALCNKELDGRISRVVSPSKIFVQLLASEGILKRYWNSKNFSSIEVSLWQNGEVYLEKTLMRVALMLCTY